MQLPKPYFSHYPYGGGASWSVTSEGLHGCSGDPEEALGSSVCWDAAAQAHQGFEEEHSGIRQAVPLSMESMRRGLFHGGAPRSTLSLA